MLSLWFCSLTYLFSLVSAKLVNVTVDDTSSSIVYAPANGWDFGPSCEVCMATPKIQRDLTYNYTWHDGTSNRQGENNNSLRTASTNFNGSSVYVFCILANTNESSTGFSEMFFLIDGQVAGTFTHIPNANASNTFEYNVPVFVMTSLSPGAHSLTIQNGHVGGPTSLVLFDYLIYTSDDGSNPSSATSPGPTNSSNQPAQSTKSDFTGEIVGAVLGTIAGVLLALVVALWYRQRNCAKLTLPTMVQKGKPSDNSSGPWFSALLKVSRHAKSNSPVNATNASSFSFNPSMLVRPMVNRSRTLLFRPPPAIVTVQPLQPPNVDSNRPDSLRPLQPKRTPSPTASIDPRIAAPQQMLIQQWQQRTYREARDVPPRLSISEVDLSSYWEMSTSAEPQPMRLPERLAPPRRYTVVNN